MRTSLRSSRSAASSTAAWARSSSACSRQRSLEGGVPVAQFLCEPGVVRCTHSRARWKSVSSQKSVRLKISWLSSMKRTGNRCRCEFWSRADFRGNTSQQHGLSATTGSHDQCVLAGCRLNVPAEDVQEDAEFMVANDELFCDFHVGLERPGIKLADRTIGGAGHHSYSCNSSLRCYEGQGGCGDHGIVQPTSPATDAKKSGDHDRQRRGSRRAPELPSPP